MFKKLKYILENRYYQLKYRKTLDLSLYKLHENHFSGKPLNIIYLTHYDGSFSINNTYLPLQEFGAVFKFELDSAINRKNWYKIKDQRNQEMIAFVKQTAQTTKIDIIVCYLSGFSTTPQTLLQIKSLNIPMINESLDDERKFRSRKGKDGIYRGMKDICQYFDLSLTTSKSAIVKYLVEGCKPIYKDYAGNEKIYKKNPAILKQHDVSFVGASYGIRGEYIHFLEQNGIRVFTKGDGWSNGFAQADEMIEIFNASKIVLGFSTVGSNDDIYILKGRDFEVPLTGSFYLTGDHEELKEYFQPRVEIETYRSKEELLNKVQYYLANENEREKIAQNGYEKALKHYTVKIAYEKLFGYLGL